MNDKLKAKRLDNSDMEKVSGGFYYENEGLIRQMGISSPNPNLKFILKDRYGVDAVINKNIENEYKDIATGQPMTYEEVLCRISHVDQW